MEAEAQAEKVKELENRGKRRVGLLRVKTLDARAEEVSRAERGDKQHGWYDGATGGGTTTKRQDSNSYKGYGGDVQEVGAGEDYASETSWTTTTCSTKMPLLRLFGVCR